MGADSGVFGKINVSPSPDSGNDDNLVISMSKKDWEEVQDNIGGGYEFVLTTEEWKSIESVINSKHITYKKRNGQIVVIMSILQWEQVPLDVQLICIASIKRKITATRITGTDYQIKMRRKY